MQLRHVRIFLRSRVPRGFRLAPARRLTQKRAARVAAGTRRARAAAAVGRRRLLGRPRRVGLVRVDVASERERRVGGATADSAQRQVARAGGVDDLNQFRVRLLLLPDAIEERRWVL